MLIRTGKKIPSLAFLLVVLLFTCTKPDQPDPTPTPTPEPTPTPQITVPTSSLSVFSIGISFNSGTTTPGDIPGTGTGTGDNPGTGTSTGNEPPSEQPQTQVVNFTAPLAWTASVEATKAVDWLVVEPSFGTAGDVTMKVTAQPNQTYEDRSATVTIKSGAATASFSVKQSGKPRPVDVTEIKLDQTELTLTEGESATLKATVLPENATNKTVTWSSSNVAVVTVDESGKVTAVAAGEATITAKAGEKTAECKVTVNGAPAPPTPPQPTVIPVASISLNKYELQLMVGESETLVATVNPADATDKDVSWSSNNSAVATVDANGKVTAVAAGNAVITAQAGGKPTSCSITVVPLIIPVSSVTLNETNLTMYYGGSVTLVATVLPENATDKTVSWSTNNPTVLAVDENGTVTAKALGGGSIIARAGDKTASCFVRVEPLVIPVSAVDINQISLNLTEGDSVTLTATVNPENATDKTVSWQSNAPDVASVDQNGKVTAVAPGNATITAQAGVKTATCSVTVVARVIPVSSIELNQTSLDMTEGDTEILTATVKPDNATDKNVTWSSSNVAAVSVDQNGKVTAVAPGNATITAQAGEKTATCFVVVAPLIIPVSSIELSQTSLDMTEGDSVTLTATVGPSNATDKNVSWHSSATGVASVDQDGKVTAIHVGHATITVTSGDIKATCDVSVSVPAGGSEGTGEEIWK